jgi:hypothetical protein
LRAFPLAFPTAAGFSATVPGQIRFLALAAAYLAGILAASNCLQAGSTSQASQPSLAFFSSVTEHEFARLHAVAIRPATHGHGPFRVPAAGLEIDTPVLHLLDLRCAPEDWEKLLAAISAWQRLPSSRPPHLALPDGRLLAFSRAPATRDGALGGLARPVIPGPASAPLHGVRIAHDGVAGLTLEVIPFTTRPAPSPAPAATNATIP